MPSKLTNRQRVFVELYLTLWNATEAARQAGYKNPNQLGPRQLVQVGIQKAIQDRIAEKKATADEVLMRLTAQSRGDMGDCLNGYGVPDIDLIRKAGKTALIKKLKSRTITGETAEIHEIEIELYDAQAATVQLGKALNVFASEAPQVNVTNNLAVIGVRPVDYRAGLADLAPGPMGDSDAPGPNEGVGDGAPLGEDGPGGSVSP